MQVLPTWMDNLRWFTFKVGDGKYCSLSLGVDSRVFFVASLCSQPKRQHFQPFAHQYNAIQTPIELIKMSFFLEVL
jgi:hypothetical protein